MKAMVLREFGKAMKMEDVEDPKSSPGDVIVEVKACGVCYTDIKVFNGMIEATRLPHIMGHEISGVVADMGEDVDGFSIGEKVVVYEYISCGECFFCKMKRENQCLRLFSDPKLGRLGLDKNGGFSEYIKAPSRNLVPVPDAVSLEAAAIAADAIATPYHAIKDNSVIREGSKVLTIGVGGLGIHGAQLAKHFGAGVLAVDIDDAKLALMERVGIEKWANPSKDDISAIVKSWTEDIGCDVILDFVGRAESVSLALKCVRNMGQIVFVGYAFGHNVEYPVQQLVSREISLMGCRASTRSNLRETLALVADGSVIPVIDRVFPLKEANEVLERLENVGFAGRAVLFP